MDAAVRVARGADAPALVALLGRQLADHSVRPTEAALAEAVDGLLRHPARGRLLVAEREGAVVGVAALSFVWTLEHGGRSAWLDELFVEPAHRGSGIGTALLDAAIRAARSAGARAIDLEIESGHERARALYERAGFARHARERWMRALAG
jgi:GNAT superfamily N-acetyltransferase